MQTLEKQVLTQAAFQKKVDTAAAHMEYMNRMKPDEARQKALEEVQANFTVQ